MRLAKVISVILLISLAYGVGRLQEQEKNIKDYQAACILSDCCRNMVDNLGVDAEEIYCDYLDMLDCYPEMRVKSEDIKDYAWCY